jgi:O-antigen ligase
MIMLQEWNWREQMTKWGWILLACYPLVDFLLRNAPVLRSTPIGSLWDKLIFLALGYLACEKWLKGEKPNFFPFSKPVFAMMLLGIGYILMNMSDFTISFAGWRAVFLYMLTVFLAPFFIDRNFAGRLIQILLWTGTLIALHAVYQWIVKVPIPPTWVDASEHVRTRVYSVFGSPNVLGSYFILLFPVAAGYALSRNQRPIQRTVYAGMALLFALGLFMTYTRGAWMALFLALLVIGALMDKRIFIGLVVASVAVTFVPQVHTRIAQLFQPLYWKKAAMNGRIARTLASYDVMRNNPFFGAGLGHYGGAVAARYFSAPYSDNYYAKTLAEMGLVGVLGFLGMMAQIVRTIYIKIWKLNQWKKGKFVEAGMFAGLLAVLIHNAVENIFEVPAMNFLFWFLLSLLFVVAEGSFADDRGKEKQHDEVAGIQQRL